MLSSYLEYTKGKMTKFHLEMIHVGSSQNEAAIENKIFWREFWAGQGNPGIK